MIIHLSTSGGIGGFGLGRSARIDIDALPEALRMETCEAMTAETLNLLAGQAGSGGADRVSYEISLDEDDGAQQRFTIGEAAIPPEMLDLIDSLFGTQKTERHARL